MASEKCPGLDLSRKKIDETVSHEECPSCGYQIEYFFDDKTRKCPSCGLEVMKGYKKLLKDFGCASWCNGAEECLGKEIYSRLKEAKRNLDKESELEKLSKENS